MQRRLPHVLRGTDHLQEKLTGTRLAHGYRLVTADVRNLYPSIPRGDFRSKMFTALMKNGVTCGKAQFLVDIARVVINSATVEHDNETYQAVSGVPTGIPPAVALANLFMACFDEDIMNEIDLPLFWRFIDDVLLGTKRSTDDLLAHLNGWNDHIQWDITHEGAVTFLDLDISLEHTTPNDSAEHNTGHEPNWTLHTKPLAKHFYVPWTSQHPPGVFTGIIQGGLQRI